MIEKIVKAIEMQYLLNRIVHSSSDCYNFVVEEYIRIIKKIDEDSMILYHFCTEDARWKNHQWVRIIAKTRQDTDLIQCYKDIVIIKDVEQLNDDTIYFNFLSKFIEIDGKQYELNTHLENIVDILYKKHEMEFEYKYKQVREQIELENIKKEFE